MTSVRACRPLLLALVLAGGCAETREAPQPDTLAPAPAAPAAMAQAAMAVRAVGDAAALAIDGRRERDPERLLEAAEAMLNLRPRERLFPGQRAADDGPGPLAPTALLDEAESMAGSDPALAERIAAVRSLIEDVSAAGGAAMGAERGPQRYSASVPARTHRRHELYFEGAAPAVIQVRGSGGTDLDAYLYDVNGDRVAADEGPTDVATVHWYVPYTQTLTLVVRNRGPRANAYYVITN